MNGSAQDSFEPTSAPHTEEDPSQNGSGILVRWRGVLIGTVPCSLLIGAYLLWCAVDYEVRNSDFESYAPSIPNLLGYTGMAFCCIAIAASLACLSTLHSWRKAEVSWPVTLTAVGGIFGFLVGPSTQGPVHSARSLIACTAFLTMLGLTVGLLVKSTNSDKQELPEMRISGI